jgi:ketosteroid isomerase-like protein
MPPPSAADLVEELFAAVERHDRDAVEALLAPSFRFTSPLDNSIDRETYFRECWPGIERLCTIEVQRVVVSANVAVVTYVGQTVDGRRFRNTEVMTISGQRFTDIEVYFGWSLPHEVPAGQHAMPS